MTPLIKFNRKQGRFVAAADELAQAQEVIRQVGRSGLSEDHRAFATTIIGPIKQVADYEEWTGMFFNPRPVADGEMIRIAINKPSMIAMFTSPNGEVLFTRPGRKYSTVDFSMVDCGLEVGWDDLRTAGWNVLERKVFEAGQELARKRDSLGKAVLDAAVASVSGHTVNSVGGVLTKAAVDTVFKAAATAGWKIDRVAINSGTIMDMTGWTMPANSLWANAIGPEQAGVVLTNGYVTNYGGAAWNAFTSVGATEVYLAASPSDTASYKFERGGIREASDIDIKKRIDLHTWDQALGYYLGNAYAIWKINIVA